MKKSLKISLIVVGVIVVIGIIGYVATRPKTKYETQKVDRGTVVETVSVTGSIEPMTTIDLQPEVTGKIKNVPVKESQTVKTGDLLLQLDSGDADARVASQVAAVASAVARLKELQAGATVSELNVAQAAVETAKAQAAAAVAAKADAQTALDNANQNFTNTKSKATSNESSKVSALLNDFDSAATVANDAVNRLTDTLFTGSDQLAFIASSGQAQTDAVNTRASARSALITLASAVSAAHASNSTAGIEAQYDIISSALKSVKQHADACAQVLTGASNLSAATLATDQQNVSTAQTTLNAAIDSITADKSGLDLQLRLNASDLTNATIAVSTATAQLTSATNAIETANAAVAQAQANYDLQRVGNRPEVIDAQKATVAAAQATLQSLRVTASKYSLHAPVDGIITNLPFNLGENVGPGQTVVTMQTQGHFQIKADISEVDIAKIKIGEPVSITLDAFRTGEVWTGKVLTIQPAEKVVEGVIFYETKIVFDNEDARLRSGMTANLDIETNRHENVLRVPIRGIQSAGTKDSVQVLLNGQPVTKDVKLGIESNDYAEVVSGLAEGDEVVVATTK